VLKIFLRSPSVTQTEALSTLIASFGYEVTDTSDASVALWSLDAPPFAPPLPHLPTLALVTFTDEKLLIELLNLGYRGYHLPDKPSSQLKRAIHSVYEGEVWAERRIMSRALTPNAVPNLTVRQAQIAELIKLGLTNKQIAARLGIAEKTVKAHVSAILEKFGAKSRLSLLVAASSKQLDGP
jgi:DNA-binding NarL/FixJ family response regulator